MHVHDYRWDQISDIWALNLILSRNGMSILCMLQIQCISDTVDVLCRSAIKLLPQKANTSQRCWTTAQATLGLTYVVWRNYWWLIQPNVSKSFMPIVFNSWWLLSHSHNDSNKDLLFYSMSSLWILKCFTKAINNHFTDSQTVVQRDSLAAGWWLSQEQDKSPWSPNERASPKAKGWTGSRLTTNYCNCTSCKRRHPQAQHRESPMYKWSFLCLRNLSCFLWGLSHAFFSACGQKHLHSSCQVSAVMAAYICWTPDPIRSQQKQLNVMNGTRNHLWSISTGCFHSLKKKNNHRIA